MFSKFKASCMITAVALATILPEQASASAASDKIHIKNNVSIHINGETLQVNDPVLNKSDYLFLPMRALYEAVGASVDWKKETLTASAIRNDKSVNLTINSKTALVDGQQVPMVVAPFMYKDRTYMPLRFVSENFGGNVNWNPTTQTVDISLTDETPGKPQGDPYILHINNQRIVMEDPIIVKQSRSYIPANYIYENLEDSSGTLLPDQSFELQIAGMSFLFKENSNQVLVNDEVVTMEGKPFMQNGKMYVPISFVVNALGGNLRYIEDKRELYLYVYQYMYTSSFLEKSYGATSKPGIVPSARLEGDRDLLISDNPETLTNKLIPKSNATLAQYQVKATSAANKHRVFGWHYNTLGTDVQIGITVQNTSSTESIEVIDSKGTSQQTGNSWVGHDIGLTIADATLNDKLKKSSSKGIVIAPGETKVIESYDLLNDYIIGFLHDLDIKAVNGGTPAYTIRTVLTKSNSNLTSILSDPVPIDVSAKHPRGAWTSSTILADLPAYSVDSPEVGYNISNGSTDHFLTTENSLSQINGAIGNPGHFGMNYKVSLPLVNQTGKAKTIKLKLAGRGGIYSGAVKVNGKVYLVPTLRVGTEYVELPDYKMKGSSETLELEFMHAGGVNLPVAIYVETK
ncbi:copper amine oxidase N-terminal domain-containing protein [Lysinibacillus sp. NPDC059133]|uniref:copper amine oxidase N-terminal domain-containing protein n=1 Tax=Lysinibacillus sp. NPDC059133 TaxID=3346737 RepID=UPI003683E25E